MAKDRPVMKTAYEVVNALRAKYAGNAFAFLEQVGDGTGARQHRWCDVLVMSLWPSRGLDIIGIEVKVSRSDWLKELSLPEKADAIARYCDYWYVAVGDENIVQAGELPSTWGMMEPTTDGKIRCKVEAKKLDPQPISRDFLAAVLRQATGQLTDVAKMASEYNRGVKDGKDERDKYFETRRGTAISDLKQLQEQVAKFEKASGIDIRYSWDSGRIGDAVRRVLNGPDGKVQEQLRRLHGQAVNIVQGIEAELAKEPMLDQRK